MKHKIFILSIKEIVFPINMCSQEYSFSFLAAPSAYLGEPNRRSNDSYKLSCRNKQQGQYRESMRDQIEFSAQLHLMKVNIKLLKRMNNKDLNVKIYMLTEKKILTSMSLEKNLCTLSRNVKLRFGEGTLK
ncbi:hypothetical protein DMUE_1857 [Dictyocoela muelleri]|nr:hypothetical protein DMUE_1857 [Dictyocoela muelleri]